MNIHLWKEEEEEGWSSGGIEGRNDTSEFFDTILVFI